MYAKILWLATNPTALNTAIRAISNVANAVVRSSNSVDAQTISKITPKLEQLIELPEEVRQKFVSDYSAKSWGWNRSSASTNLLDALNDSCLSAHQKLARIKSYMSNSENNGNALFKCIAIYLSGLDVSRYTSSSNVAPAPRPNPFPPKGPCALEVPGYNNVVPVPQGDDVTVRPVPGNHGFFPAQPVFPVQYDATQYTAQFEKESVEDALRRLNIPDQPVENQEEESSKPSRVCSDFSQCTIL